MIEETKASQPARENQELSRKVGSSEGGAGVTMLDAVSGLLGSKKIPTLGAVQTSALLHYLFNAAEPPLRFQIAEVVYRYDHDHTKTHRTSFLLALYLRQRRRRGGRRETVCSSLGLAG